jgi:hypothetical protein
MVKEKAYELREKGKKELNKKLEELKNELAGVSWQNPSPAGQWRWTMAGGSSRRGVAPNEALRRCW